MEPHIRKTVEEIDNDILGLQKDIDALTAARTTIVNLYGGETEVPPAPVKKPSRGGQIVDRPDVKIVTPGATGKPLSPDTAKIIAIAAGMTEPFSTSDLRVAANCDAKQASNFIIRWTAKGWLKRLEFGSYERTPAFPGQTPTTN